MLFRPLDFAFVGREGGDELGAWCAVEEMEGMPGTHAAETGTGDLELAGRHVARREDSMKLLFSMRSLLVIE